MKKLLKRGVSKLRNRKGSSLVEVIVSFLIIMIAIGIFYGGYQMSLAYFYEAEELNEKTEALLSAYYDGGDEGTALNGEFVVNIPQGDHDGSIMSTGACEIGKNRKFTVHYVERDGIRLYFFKAAGRS